MEETPENDVVNESLFISMFVESTGVCDVDESGIVWRSKKGIVWG